uniref:RRM domain-containing protein n=1 Tax=Arundo donax TaxID=35708 RepID=A0A0A9CPG3_ARUDO
MLPEFWMFGIFQSFSRTKGMSWRPDLFSDSMAASGIETGTKLYISNLDYRVSNEDIKELFSEVGHLKRFSVHYDGYGCPNGTAEVVFTRRSDALAALKRYNNVLLDGKAMKIEVIGSDLGLPMTPRINVVGASNGRATRTVVMTPEFGQRGRGSGSRPLSNPGNRWNRGAFQAGGGRGRGRAQFQARGRGRGQFQGRGRGRGRKPEKTADELDKDLESYHADAMKTD